ncbi:PepSY domain-containing protein [Mesobacillus maritimus]|uniref:PepSY domain-containing protein n=1 Tax=Mesobacillus maritimus TaxID=1643336 RepID=UPI00203B3EDD|nr:PepSY domain-containing protein [Mesobacillus maritimus]MCM3670329.1 PepSY domain-containing protein [Mesobacillus maritimus]
MDGAKKKKLGIGAVILLVIMIAVWQISNIMTSAEPLTAEEATNKVKDLYSGEIVEVKEGKELYLITIELETGTYEIEIDRLTGDIGSMTRTTTDLADKEQSNGKNSNQEDSQETPSSENPQGSDDQANGGKQSEPKPESSGKKPEAPKLLSEKEAIAIALKEINGEVEEVELQTSDGITYYLIEVEREVNDEDEEATIKINAVTGEVKSIFWEE